MSSKLAPLSRYEWTVMKICWEKGTTIARVIYEESLNEKKRSYHTISTMLKRLVKKGYLKSEKLGPLWLYTPNVPRSKVIKQEIETFVTNVLDNTFTPLLSFLTEKHELSDEEIEALEKLLKKKRGKTDERLE